MNKDDRLRDHFESWQNGNTDKQLHFFWFISAGPGSGKSRCLDEFPGILRTAVSQQPNCKTLQKRLDEMCIFKVSFENGKKDRGHIPDVALLPAHVAFQLQESSISWEEYCVSETAKAMTFAKIFRNLLAIRRAATAKDLTILILIDGVQEAGNAVRSIMAKICDLTNAAAPFVMIACSSTVQIPVRTFLKTSGQHFVHLTPPAISEPIQLTEIYERMPNENRLMAKIMIKDMGGHGRALEYLAQMFTKSFNLAKRPSVMMAAVKERLKYAYPNWDPFPSSSSSSAQAAAVLIAIIRGLKLSLQDTIPGTDLTVDDILQVGLFRYDAVKRKLTVAYIWILLICDMIEIPELQALIGLDHDQLMGKIQHGAHPSLSFAAFEEFWCNFRAARSRCFGDGETVKWSIFHSGAYFTKNCDFKFVNKHLSFCRAAHQFGTKSSCQDLIALTNGTRGRRDQFLDIVILNQLGALSGNSAVFLLFPDQVIRTEAHQDKNFDVSTIRAIEILDERMKAADPTDCFILVYSGKVDKEGLDQLPERTAIIDAQCFEEYFGPLAGRAFAYRNTGPVDVNSACFAQLMVCIGVGEKIARDILQERQVRLFSGPDDFAARVRKFSPLLMQQFWFLQSSD